jgi:hypothetical protein
MDEQAAPVLHMVHSGFRGFASPYDRMTAHALFHIHGCSSFVFKASRCLQLTVPGYPHTPQPHRSATYQGRFQRSVTAG